MIVGDAADGFDVRHIQTGIADRFTKQKFGFVGDRSAKILRIARIDKVCVDAELRQDVVELCERSAVQIVGGHNFIAHATKVDHAVKNRARPRSNRQPGDAPFKLRHPLFEHVVRGVHNPRINIPQFPQRKQVSCVFGIAKHIRTRPMHRHAARHRRRIGLGSGM